MLKVTDKGVLVTLQGKDSSDNKLIFWMAAVLLLGAVVVALSMSFLSTTYAMLALVALVIASYFFNKLRVKHEAGKRVCIGHGKIEAQPKLLITNTKKINIENEDTLQIRGNELCIYNENKQLKCKLMGFENDKEIQVTQQVLQGNVLNKRNANIKMKST